MAAFPGAEGYGRMTTGGRGGEVYIVTSLADDGMPGTLRYGIEKLDGPRTIIFQVSGTIFLHKDLKIRKGNLTILSAGVQMNVPLFMKMMILLCSGALFLKVLD